MIGMPEIGHLAIGPKARIGAQAGVMSDVPDGADVLGSPAQPVREFFRQVALLRKMSRPGTPRSPQGRSLGNISRLHPPGSRG